MDEDRNKKQLLPTAEKKSKSEQPTPVQPLNGGNLALNDKNSTANGLLMQDHQEVWNDVWDDDDFSINLNVENGSLSDVSDGNDK